MTADADERHDAAAETEASFELLQRAQAGDTDAIERLMARYLPRLRRWASGRLPRAARDLADTSDLVQNTLFNTFRRIETLQAGRDGGLQAYLRQAVMNGIRDELRRAQRRPAIESIDSAQPAPGRSPLELAIGQENIDCYERALASLRPQDREAIVARVELGCTYVEIALLLSKPSDDAARKAVERAMVLLIERMRRERTERSAQIP
jgi:RNA polymerase sigma factor (sigma-70 family)